MISRKAWTADYSGYGQSVDMQCRVNEMLTNCGVALHLTGWERSRSARITTGGATTATVLIRYVSGRRESHLVSIPLGSLASGFSETFRGAAEQFQMGRFITRLESPKEKRADCIQVGWY